MENATPIQTEPEVPTKSVERHVAYMMQQGDNYLQYKAYKLVVDENDKIVEKTMIGTPDLKAVVFGRLLKLIFLMR